MKKEMIFAPFQSAWIAGQVAIWLLMLVGSFLVACLLQFTSFDASYLPLSAYILNALALLVGGWITGRKTKRKGWYFGGLQGVIYALCLLIIGFLAFDTMIRIHPFLFIICAFGLSAIGGIFGENTSKN